MKMTFEVPEDEILERAKEICAERVAKELYSAYSSGYAYRKMIKEIVREVIRADIDNLSERAVNAASKSIENRAVKKLLDKLGDDGK